MGVAALAVAWSSLACVSVTTSSGARPQAEAPTTPTGRAASRASGLGPNAPNIFWTEGGGTAGDVKLSGDTYIHLADQASPAVVSIFTTQEYEARIGDPLGILRVPLDANLEATSLGTGFFISRDGFLLTNAHVVAKADRIHIFMHDRSEAKEVRVVGVDSLTDLALLKVETQEPTPFLSLADSDDVRIGEMVVAIGNPFGLDYSVTTGVISAKNRVLNAGRRRGLYEDFLQTSAQINPGNSGGPLINLRGEVVGVNTAIIAQAQGIGFAVPSNLVKGLLPGLARYGKISRGYSGIGLAELNPAIARRLGVNRSKGAVVVSLDPDGPGARAGVKVGDVITAIDGESIESSIEASRRITVMEPGHHATLSIQRGGGETVTVKYTTSSKTE
ncbi:MAG: trypsin-like peptidase domain-containing protein [Deltaproteobacteria bacterium]|nr:trypsin-like peptidase domain-containing protein [Deltaproteobacteria bacterium]MCB9488661.1 trypsin-like peptidase domain-containing protein [Deltaproteobacteria bacterium]